MPPSPRILVLVCSCLGFIDRTVRAADAAGCAAKRAACRETWLARRPEGVRYAFFVGASEQPAGEPDVWALNAPDTYHGLPEKVRAAFARALGDEGWDWIFKCDDDTFCSLRRLRSFVRGLAPRAAITSWPGNWCDTAHGGAGYLLPRAMVEAVVRDPLYNKEGIDHEDKQVTYSVRRAGGVRLGDRRFCATMQAPPEPGNEQISCHQATPEDMRRLQANLAVEEHLPQPWQRPQGRVSATAGQSLRRASANPRPNHRRRLADGLRLPEGVRRVIIFSNVPSFSPALARVRRGDFCIHCNRAVHYSAVRRIPGTWHALLVRHSVRRKSGEVRWFDPPTTDGMAQVIHICDETMSASRPWWTAYRKATGKCPTTGHIAWRLALEATGSPAPIILAGFAPGEPCGSPLWSGHAWSFEAAIYRQNKARIIAP